MLEGVQNPRFDQLEASLNRAGAALNPAESHGLVCGMLCASGRLDEQLWLGQVLEDADLREESVRVCQHALLGLARTTLTQLNDPALEFSLLLPDEEDSLTSRTAALVDWSGSFLLGLGLGGIGDQVELPADVAEIIQDIREISCADVEGGPQGEDEERALAELVEYVRISVLLVNEELQPMKAPPRLQ
jgi:uncharacterized protein YgfB (UPF0149 family)